MNIIRPYNLIKVLFERHYPGYIYSRELVDCSEYGGGEIEMVNCYSDFSGDFIGDAKMARFLCKKMGLRQIQKARSDHNACSVGISPGKAKWYGWSHRAICGFGIGDMMFEAQYGGEDTPFVEHGSKPITTLAEARESAARFAEYVS